MEMEADAFESPWCEEDFEGHIKAPESVALVVESDTEILGYLVFGLDDEWIRVFSCVVADGYRRHGIGSAMVNRLIGTSAAQRRKGIAAHVPERNVAAQLLFRSCGLRAVAILPGYLLDGQDVYLMRYAMPGAMRYANARSALDDGMIPLWEVKHG